MKSNRWKSIVFMYIAVMLIVVSCGGGNSNNNANPDLNPNPDPSSAANFTSFSFSTDLNDQLSGNISGTISGTTILVTIPYGTDTQNLIASFSTTGETVTINGTTQVSGNTLNDFSNTVTYTVIAEDYSENNYDVTVTILPEDSSDNGIRTPKAPGTKIYYLDPINGADINDGTEEEPLKSFNALWPKLTGGEIVYLMDGEYDDFETRQQVSYSEWISFLPYEDHQPKLGRMVFFAWDGFSLSQYNGVHDYRLDFIGLHFEDGVSVRNIRRIWFRDCVFNRRDPLTGSEEAISKSAVHINSSSYVRVEKCDITQTAIGINMGGENIEILDSTIHHITHDGMQVIGAHKTVIEGNRIYNADDGVDDDSGYNWNRHNDGIHVYISGSIKDWRLENNDVTIRGNVIYDINGQGIMMNNYNYSQNGFQNRNFLIENNIFGPTVSPVFHNHSAPAENLIFRHNTIIYFGDDSVRTFTGITGREISCYSYNTTYSDQTTGLQVYNNIFATNVIVPTNAVRRDYNMIQTTKSGNTALGKGSFLYEEPLFSNPDSFDGKLLSGTPAINGGTRLSSDSLTLDITQQTDFYGQLRDNRPDIGAYEESGNSPLPEEVLVLDTNPKTVFTDNFDDGDLLTDVWLDGPGVQGLSWKSSHGYKVTHNNTFDSLGLDPPVGDDGGSLVLSEHGALWNDYTMEFKATTYLPQSDGPIVLAKDTDNYYWFDIAKTTGRLVRVIDGVETQLAQNDSLRLPHGGVQDVEITVEHLIPNGIRFQVLFGNIPVFDHTDSSDAANNFDAGGIGFHRFVTNPDYFYHRILVDDVKVTLTP